MDFCSAIASRQLLSFMYDGHPRVVQPAAYGTHISTGGFKLRAYQVGGSSASGLLPEWRLFSVEKMQGIEILAELFISIPPGYTPGDQHLNVICEL